MPSLMRAILPSLQSPCLAAIQDSLKLLVLSGEALHLPLCNMLLKSLPQTSILNLYGSTEVRSEISVLVQAFGWYSKTFFVPLLQCTYDVEAYMSIIASSVVFIFDLFFSQRFLGHTAVSFYRFILKKKLLYFGFKSQPFRSHN